MCFSFNFRTGNNAVRMNECWNEYCMVSKNVIAQYHGSQFIAQNKWLGFFGYYVFINSIWKIFGDDDSFACTNGNHALIVASYTYDLFSCTWIRVFSQFICLFFGWISKRALENLQLFWPWRRWQDAVISQCYCNANCLIAIWSSDMLYLKHCMAIHHHI